MLRDQLRAANPVIVLLRVGFESRLGIDIPIYDWQIVTGFSTKTNQFFLDSPNGNSYALSPAQLIEQWGGDNGPISFPDFLAKAVGSIRPFTMIYTDGFMRHATHKATELFRINTRADGGINAVSLIKNVVDPRKQIQEYMGYSDFEYRNTDIFIRIIDSCVDDNGSIYYLFKRSSYGADSELRLAKYDSSKKSFAWQKLVSPTGINISDPQYETGVIEIGGGGNPSLLITTNSDGKSTGGIYQQSCPPVMPCEATS